MKRLLPASLMALLLLGACWLCWDWLCVDPTIAPQLPGESARPSVDESSADDSEVGIWRKRLIEGEDVVFKQRSPSGETSDREWVLKSMGPLKSIRSVERLLVRTCATMRSELESAAPEENLEDVASRSRLYADMEQYAVCLDLLRDGNYITIPAGTSLSKLPKTVDWMTYDGGEEMKSERVEVVFLIARGDRPHYDIARTAALECEEALLEEKAGLFNNQSLERRMLLIRLHLESVRMKDLILSSSEAVVDGSSRQKQLKEAQANLLDHRLSIDRRAFELRVPH